MKKKTNYYNADKFERVSKYTVWWKRVIIKLLPQYVAIEKGHAVFYKILGETVYVVGSEPLKHIDKT